MYTRVLGNLSKFSLFWQRDIYLIPYFAKISPLRSTFSTDAPS